MPRRREGGLPGERYGQLTVLEEALKKGSKRYVKCRCDCGEETIARLGHLKSGQIRACGCLMVSSRVTHGRSGTPEYRTWTHIIDRCTNPKCNDWKNYGGRGITICDLWRKSFEAFLEDVGKRPDPQHTLDRIDNEKGYEPGNVRWASRKVQARNTRHNRLLTHRGKTKPLIQWAEDVGISPRTLMTRVSRGWSVERALTQPIKKVEQSWRRSIISE